MLEIQNVSKTFNAGTVNEKTALNGLNLKLNEGDFVTVIGGNGAGKSTMLNAVAGVWPVDCGKIIIDGVDVTRLGEHQRAAYIGRVFQDPMTGTAATMQIEENLALAARRGKRRGLQAGNGKGNGACKGRKAPLPPYQTARRRFYRLRLGQCGGRAGRRERYDRAENARRCKGEVFRPAVP